MQERIVAPAPLMQESQLVLSASRPARHDKLLRMAACHGLDVVGGAVQGFLTSEGRFVGRREAEDLARACGQLREELLGSKLTSEDLW